MLNVNKKCPAQFVTTPTQLILNSTYSFVKNCVIMHHAPSYEDLFSKEVKKFIRMGLILSQQFDRRKRILNNTGNRSR